MAKTNKNSETIKFVLELNEDQIVKIAACAVGMIKKEDVARAPEKFYSVNEVAEMIPSVNADTIRRHCRDGIIKASKTGKSFLISENNLNQYLSRNEE